MKSSIAILASVFLVAGAYGQPATPAEPAGHSRASSAPVEAKEDLKVEKHIKALHDRLKITAPEETEWNAVARTMRESARELDAAIDKRRAIAMTASAVDDLNAYSDIAQAHADGVKRLAGVFGPLYAAMSESQKKAADAIFSHRAHGEK
jgi:hypothetical protein